MNVTAISSNFPMPQVNESPKKVSEEDEEKGGIEFLQSLGQAGQKPQPVTADLQMVQRMALQGKAQAAQAAQASPERPLGIGDAVQTSQASAVSTNTGAAIAGLQPWSRDWVFTQGDIQNPDQVQGILSRGDAAQTTELKQAQAQLPALERLLSQMRGDVEGIAVASEGVPPEGAVAPASKGKVMSGGDFLGALEASSMAPAQMAKSKTVAAAGGKGNAQAETAFGKPELKVIDGGRLKKGGPLEMGESKDLFAPTLSGADILRQSGNPTRDAGAIPMPVVTGHVVQGRMAQDRLSSEALLGISNNISGISGNRLDPGAGEIRVRLRPDHLGELHLKVSTDGNAVGLKIQASDARAKQILEESLPHLKDSLSAQSLRLGQVEVFVAQAGNATSANNDPRQDMSGSQFNPQSNDLARQNSGGSQSQSRWDRDSSTNDTRSDRTAWAQPATASAAARRSTTSGGSRIDLHA